MLKKTVMFIIFIAVALGLNTSIYADKNKLFSLQLTNNPLYNINLNIKEDTIYFSGNCDGDILQKVFVKSLKGTAEDRILKKTDNSFEGYIKAKCAEKYSSINFVFVSGEFVSIPIIYENGWYFLDSEIVDKNANVLKNIHKVGAEVTAYYIDSVADEKSIENTLSEISKLSEKLTKNAEGDYEKAKIITLWIANNIYYDKDAFDRNEVSGETVALDWVLKNKKTVCVGFCNLYSAMLEAVGIRSVSIRGTALGDNVSKDELENSPQNHGWNAFWLESEKRWVYVDTCWCTTNDFKDGKYIKGAISLNFFDNTESSFALSHKNNYAEERSYFDVSDTINANEFNFSQAELQEVDESNYSPTKAATLNSEKIEEETKASVLKAETEETQRDYQTKPPYTNREASETAKTVILEDDSYLYISVILVLAAAIVITISIIIFKRKG